nr:DNA-directed DNA polymerase [Tanacetum cinerariifolium]
MADNRTMEELLQAPTEGYGEAIIIPKINANHFEIKTNLLQLVQANPYRGLERENPHTHINNFKRITSTFKFRDVPNNLIMLMMFPYSLEGNARVWDNASKLDDRIDKIADQISTLVDSFAKKIVTPFSVKAVEESCVTCGAMLLKKLLEKLRDPGKFLILCDFLGMDVCHALADLGASINLMPLSIWKKLSLPELTPTRMTLELADRSITRPKGVTEDVFVKVRKFHFLTDFLVVEFEADPRVPLILGRSFLRIGHALINIYGEEITLRVNDEAVTFNLNQTTRYSSTYDDLSVNRIDIIKVAREEYAQEILGFSNNSSGGNPTSTFKPILSDSSPPLTPFEGSDFILEEINAYLKNKLVSPEIDHAECDPKGDICLIEKLLNNDPFQLPLIDLKQGEVVKAKSSIEEPQELELKELPSHLEYAYLEGVDKLPVIISKDLKVDEKEALLKVLKSHKRAIAWKITDIKGNDPRFCTHKILMEEDYKPAVQSQNGLTQKFMSPWVSPIHCVPKKGGITVVENEDNELIPTRLVTGWRVCIDYRKLNDATRKDHFPLPFMDQMLERLVGNEFYCFLDGFSGYFQISINPPDQKKTTFTCPYGTFAYRIMPFGLCNAPRTFQRCMMAIFHDMIEKAMEVFMDDFLVFGDSFSSPWVSPIHCVPKKGGITVVEKENNELIPTQLVIGWSDCIDYRKLNDATHKDHFPLPFMDQILERLAGNEFYCFLDGFSGYIQISINLPDQEKTTFTCPYRTFSYRRISFGLCNAPGHFKDPQDQEKTTFMCPYGTFAYRRMPFGLCNASARPMTRLPEKDTSFFFSKKCIESFQTLKKKLTEAPILVALDWDLPFELMCDASDFAI